MRFALFIIGIIVATLLVQFGWNIGLVQAGVARNVIDFWTALALLVVIAFARSIFGSAPRVLNVMNAPKDGA